MALMKIIPPGPIWPAKHKRTMYPTTMQGRTMMRHFPRVHRPRGRLAPPAQLAMWGDWWVRARRKYHQAFALDWLTADLPINQAFWNGLAATVQIPTYKGVLRTVNGFEWWMWYTWQTLTASNWQRFPFDIAGFKPYWYPTLPWSPPATPIATVTRNNSPADFEVTYDYLPSWWEYHWLLSFWISTTPTNTPDVQPSHFLEWWATTYYLEGAGVRVPYDFSTIKPTVRPRTRALIGWAYFIQEHFDGTNWLPVYQVTPRRWLSFNFA